MTPNDDHVICPNCVHQFRAIPVNVQKLMLGVGFEPPFTTPPQRTWVDLTPQELTAVFADSITGEGAVHLALAKFKEKNNGN